MLRFFARAPKGALRPIQGRQLILLLVVASMAQGTSGCASASSAAARAPHFAFSELPKHPEALALIAERPVVLTFEAGDHVPVEFTLESSVLATASQPEKFEVIASRKFSLLVDPEEPRFPHQHGWQGLRPRAQERLSLRVQRDARTSTRGRRACATSRVRFETDYGAWIPSVYERAFFRGSSDTRYASSRYGRMASRSPCAWSFATYVNFLPSVTALKNNGSRSSR